MAPSGNTSGMLAVSSPHPSYFLGVEVENVNRVRSFKRTSRENSVRSKKLGNSRRGFCHSFKLHSISAAKLIYKCLVTADRQCTGVVFLVKYPNGESTH